MKKEIVRKNGGGDMVFCVKSVAALTSVSLLVSTVVACGLPAVAADNNLRFDSQTRDIKALLRDGISLMRSNHNQEACDKLQQLVNLNPSSAEAQHSLGLVLAKLGRMTDAIAALKKAVELSPDSEASWLTLGGLYQANGNMEEALSTYQTFLDRFPDNRMKKKVEGLREALNSEKKESTSRADQERLLHGEAPAASPSDKLPAHSMVAPLAATFGQGGTDDYLSQVLPNGAVSRWDRRRIPITVFINEGVGISGYRDSFDQILKRSFEDWATASEGTIAFKYVNSPKEARLQCFWTEKVSNLANPAEAGDARIITDQDGICQGEIWLLTRPVSRTVPLTDNYFRLVCLHEIGHALGLSGHTTNPDDVMFFSATFKDSWRDLSGRDCRSIKRFYADR